MGSLLQNKKLLMGGGVILALVAGAYMFLGSGSSGVPSLSSVDAPAPSGVPGGTETGISEFALVERELIDELLNLKNITLDKTPLESAAYLSLQDFSKPIEPEPVGRSNPFLPFTKSATTSGNQ